MRAQTGYEKKVVESIAEGEVSSQVTAKCLGLSLDVPRRPPPSPPPQGMIGIQGILPSPELMQAMGMFLPKILNRRKKLDPDLIPKNSIIRQAVVEDGASPSSSSKMSHQNSNQVTVSEHKIDTPFGTAHIKSMSGSFSVPLPNDS